MTPAPRRFSRLAQTAGLEVIVASPRRVQLITRNERENDRTDAELLARLGRVDPQLHSPVQHRSMPCQADLGLKRARDVAVASRTALINHVRGAIKSFGQRLPTCSADGFHKRVLAKLHVELVPALRPSHVKLGVYTDPESFGPDRFTPERAEDRRHEHAFVPQGTGPATRHRCPGLDFATYFMAVFAVVLLRGHAGQLPPQSFEINSSKTPPEPKDALRATVRLK